MPHYRYNAVDAQGTPVSGELTAASPEQALGQLAARGLRLQPADLVEVTGDVAGLPTEPPGGPEVSKGGGDLRSPTRRGRETLAEREAAELAGQVAELAGAGLPLAPGLRAMAEEVRRGPLARMLRRVADRLEAGSSVEAALEAEGPRFPAHVRGLITAGVRSGRLGDVLEELLSQRRKRIELRRRVWAALAYPLFLSAVLVAIYVFFSVAVVPQFLKVFADFETELPGGTKALAWLVGPGMWVILGLVGGLAIALVAAATLPRPAWTRLLFYGVPLVGPLWRYSRLAEFARLMALLLDERLPLPSALRLAGEAVRSPEITAACRAAAQRVEAGASLEESAAGLWPFPASLMPLLGWGQKVPSLAEAFRAAADMFESRMRGYVTLVESLLPPIFFLLVLGMLLAVVVNVMMPMFSLVQKLW